LMAVQLPVRDPCSSQSVCTYIGTRVRTNLIFVATSMIVAVPLGKAPFFGPPCIADFRLVVPDDTGGLIGSLERVYNTPDPSLVQPGGPYAHLAEADPDFAEVCMHGLVRVGVGIIPPPTVRSTTLALG
jgi:hypothetical protein